jgi:alpha-amylase/alpha-mannosidase (GH57 family)
MSGEDSALPVVLCWHMHQPDYRGFAGSDYELPGVYLHGIKDYLDMAAHLEAAPQARAVVNFAPVLLEQLNDYTNQIDAWLEQGSLIADPLLAALAGPGLPLDAERRDHLIRACLRANDKRLIDRFPVFKALAAMARWSNEHPPAVQYLNDQFLADLLVWYHLAWMGESLRTTDLRVISLQDKERYFTPEDRRILLQLIAEQLRDLLPRYRALAEQGRVELAMSPHSHPILPLLLDFNAAREAMPEVELPELKGYPGGEARVRWHIRKGIEIFEKHFGTRPRGCWPSEGALCDDSLRILDEEGFDWTASGQQVLHNSLSREFGDDGAPDGWLYRPWRVHEGRLRCYFRDDGVSDLIGFTYADWHADDAVANLLEHLESIEKATRGQDNRVLSIIMDGENAWEYYPHNGNYFLSRLYTLLSAHPHLRLETFSGLASGQGRTPDSMDRLVSGSWVYGTLSTWIGDADKNRAWDMLGEAKQVYDKVVATERLSPEQRAAAELQLATCEGSDWFWWFGDYNPGATVSDFERLFRRQLTDLYRLLGETAPEYLSSVFAQGSGDPEMGGVMRKNQ